jgi:DNA topoisomerase-1
LKVFGKVEEEEEENENSQALPELKEQENLDLIKLLPNQHFTEPPPRFNEASLIKKLEELGIGRPSTYAPILSTIQDRYYVEKREKKFFPTELGITVNTFLMKYFPDIFDYAFTAEMEDNLDSIATGEMQWKPIIAKFYEPFAQKLEKVEGEAERVKIVAEETDQDCPECGKKLVIKFGKFGKFLACSGFPECKHTESFEQKVDAICGGEIVMRKTRKGRPFYGCKNWPTCKFASWTKPSLRPSGLKPKKATS